MARKAPPISDICLLLEGTYPYVSGGVSTWVHQLITAFPQWKFSIFYIGGEKEPGASYKYKLPENVIKVEELHLFDVSPRKVGGTGKALPSAWTAFHTGLRKLLLEPPTGTLDELGQVAQLFQHIRRDTSVSFERFYHSPQTWQFLQEMYRKHAAEESFLHFFWTVRYLMEPMWKLARAMDRVPKAHVYHSACTGYAGFLGALLSQESGAPLLLSEHGIYLKERMQDIYRSRWITESPTLRPALNDPLGSHRRVWIKFFDLLGRVCYEASSHMVSLFGENARVQAHFGAPRQKISIIPNGIATEAVEPLYLQRLARRQQQPDSKVVGFLGRVVPIKDVLTLIRAARLVCDATSEAQFLIAGPMDEDPGYSKECMLLVTQLRLESHVQFLGLRQRDDVLPLMDVMVLTSISEGLPFVILEALACGVPVVSTDVGACRELIAGSSGENPPLGACGLIAETGNAEEISRALLRILNEPALEEQMSAAGRARVTRYYHEKRTLSDYENLYAGLISPASPTLQPVS